MIKGQINSAGLDTESRLENLEIQRLAVNCQSSDSECQTALVCKSKYENESVLDFIIPLV